MKTNLFLSKGGLMVLVVLLTSTMFPINGPEVQVDVTWGRGPHCTGRGFCSMQSSTDGNGVFLMDDFGRLSLRVDKTKLSAQEIWSQFSNNTFVLEESWVLPKFIVNHLQITGDTVIQPGGYPLEEDPFHYYVRLSEKQ